jgi:hypothetical protein
MLGFELDTWRQIFDSYPRIFRCRLHVAERRLLLLRTLVAQRLRAAYLLNTDGSDRDGRAATSATSSVPSSTEPA